MGRYMYWAAQLSLLLHFRQHHIRQRSICDGHVSLFFVHGVRFCRGCCQGLGDSRRPRHQFHCPAPRRIAGWISFLPGYFQSDDERRPQRGLRKGAQPFHAGTMEELLAYSMRQTATESIGQGEEEGWEAREGLGRKRAQ